MLLLKTERLPEGPDLPCEFKLDGYRVIAFKKGGQVYLRLRNDNELAARVRDRAGRLGWRNEETSHDGIREARCRQQDPRQPAGGGGLGRRERGGGSHHDGRSTGS